MEPNQWDSREGRWGQKNIQNIKKLFLSMLSYVPTIDGQWGGLVEGTNDTWNGMIGMLQRKVAK